jgi:hypothetical protein
MILQVSTSAVGKEADNKGNAAVPGVPRPATVGAGFNAVEPPVV